MSSSDSWSPKILKGLDIFRMRFRSWSVFSMFIVKKFFMRSGSSPAYMYSFKFLRLALTSRSTLISLRS
jgi:hypothetical protein